MIKGSKSNFLFVVFFSTCCFVSIISSVEAGLSDFNLSNNQVSLDDFHSGGPDKDGIPAISKPNFLSANEHPPIPSDQLILGVSVDGESKAYPINILNWHEVVNDKIASQPIAVTWCPLTKSGVVFDRRVENKTLEFGVSGLLYNSNVLIYDRNHEGLWSQLDARALTGIDANQSLSQVPSQLTTWGKWLKVHTDTFVLSDQTGSRRDYQRDPYQFYHQSSDVLFPIGKRDTRLPAKSIVIGIKVDNVAKAYPVALLEGLGEPLKDKVGDKEILIHPDSKRTAYVTDSDGVMMPTITLYWFAWSIFHKETLVYGYEKESNY